MWQYNYTHDYLCHWGIKGMKWGVRRYQNKDGSLTPEGKKRYSEEGNSGETSKPSSSGKSTQKSISDMSDDELRKLVNRKQTEKQLRDLIAAEDRASQTVTPAVQQKGQSVVAKALKSAGEQALTTMAKGAILYAGSNFVKNALNNPELAKAIATGSMGGSSEKKKEDDKKD